MICMFLSSVAAASAVQLKTDQKEESDTLECLDNHAPTLNQERWVGKPVKDTYYSMAVGAKVRDQDGDQVRLCADFGGEGKDESSFYDSGYAWQIYVDHTYVSEIGTKLTISFWGEDEHGAESTKITQTVTVSRTSSMMFLFLPLLLERFLLLCKLLL